MAHAEPPDAGDWRRVTLRAELRADSHFGSGVGGGGLDALVARDRDERPVIWASHVEGVLRDAARRLWGAARTETFFGGRGGRPQRAVFTSLYLDAGADPRTRTWRSSARRAVPDRGPRDEMLRFVEHVPRGARFTGCVEVPAGDLADLRRLVREVDALGTGRAAGAGRVALTLEEPAEPAPLADGEAATGRLVLVLRNRDPLCITATATPDNLVPSLAFVPGRTLLGALAGWLIAQGERDTAALLLDGRAKVSDALPLPRVPACPERADVLPAPLALQSDKPGSSAGAVPWWALPRAAVPRHDGLKRDENAAEGGEKRPKGKRPEADLFVYRDAPDQPWTAYRPLRRVRLRNGRSDPNQADPSLFALEQIAERTSFLCELRAAPDVLKRLAGALRPVLDGRRWLRVGRGGAPVEVERYAWAPDPPGPSEPAPDAAVLTLTSDLLVRDEHLRWCTALDESRLRALLERTAVQLGASAEVCVSRDVVQDSTAVHGFNGTARLWRMPAYAVRGGSVFRVEGAGVKTLATMQARGMWLGERTHEGFGRFRLDPALPGVTAQADDAATTTRAAAATARNFDAADDEIARTTRRWFDSHCALADRDAQQRRPSLSQWFNLVAELDREHNPHAPLAPNTPLAKSAALAERRQPQQAGALSWTDPDAKAVLTKLENMPHEQRAAHARMFVRWLRVKLRRQRDGELTQTPAPTPENAS